MPSYFVTQPNGQYAIFSTVVDNFTGYDFTEPDCLSYYAAAGLVEPKISQQWQRVIDDVIPHPSHHGNCCDQKPLRRWHDCLNTILHVHGTAELHKVLSEMRSAWEAT